MQNFKNQILCSLFWGYFMVELPTAPLDRLMRKSGCERVSVDAVKAMIEVISSCVAHFTGSCNYGKYAGRKTVTVDYVKLAAKTV